MQKSVLTLTALLLVLTTSINAQEKKEPKTTVKKEKKETVVIKKNGTGKEKVTVVIDGEKITVNGVPAEEFKDEEIEIVRSLQPAMGFPMPSMRDGNFEGKIMMSPPYSSQPSNKALLGVSTQKVENGVEVTSVATESAAEKAGLKEGDIITTINEQAINTSEDLQKTIGKYKPNDKITVTYLRDGKTNTVEATLGRNNAMRVMTFNEDNIEMFNNGQNSFFSSISRKPKLGLQVQDLEEGNGVKVLEVDDETPAAKAGMQENDIILELNDSSINTVDELRAKLKDFKEGDSFKLKFKRAGKIQVADIKFPKKLKTASL